MSFAALLASVGKEGQPATAPVAKSPAPASAAQKPKPTMVANASKTVASPGTLKRKADDGDAGTRPKTLRTDTNSAAPRAAQTSKAQGISTTKPAPAATTEYKGTARAATSANPVKPRITANAPVRPAVGSNTPTTTTPASSTAPAPKKGGFAATLARAAAAQQANKGSGGINIVHKPVEKLSRRERERQKQQQEAAEKEKQKQRGVPVKGKLAQQAGRSRSATPGDAKAGSQPKKGPVQVGYSGTMRKPVEVGYSGTMRSKDPAKAAQPAKQKDKFGGQDRYGGYASWSDLSDAEEEEEDYYSDSDDMEGGFDDLEREEAATARLARKEDMEALAEEERLKKEKADRKKRLEAMAKQASVKKRY